TTPPPAPPLLPYTTLFRSQLSSIRTHDTRDRVGGITAPTLVLAGEEDILIPVSLSKELHSLIPGATWKTTRGGHACCWEHPAARSEEHTSELQSLRHLVCR